MEEPLNSMNNGEYLAVQCTGINSASHSRNPDYRPCTTQTVLLKCP
ncbi:hypothetical protein SLEP1_g4240 [Rubroshorea leprosula]|uniref:Uncharacterized protein n=1 Tax=Rubroshorea leprosula TaxID=152421 RepID=A0AAV5HUH6_9ROSI|nr:hypothetical protein SLEP1_g4240 [Rubroshorea leprosula]